ncbi:hypothetical protein BO86DRAFT_423230 [Aspergillus japonicus CBS 114.51]|uniref:NADH:flavin oxidoreductase/NADH oxidase N-terminal domain-containing protein n=1 Tax=Aspergillus japonicus CBS 114.51 TaxID=1448312 RepID=A0A8T8WKZ5_ASPJA|nr:hypothetical protein BO86DRAFT_423230 [Aspergillus japonicus CBS 114.51]RAH76354.1 hypothetical protein BO86DRAFT_423230 [Aspergillus japonicus CBS 114.51]
MAELLEPVILGDNIQLRKHLISPHGAKWPHASVMDNDEHARAWTKVTSAVHDRGGRSSSSLGRIQNGNMPMLKDNGYLVHAPSKIAAKKGKLRTIEGTPGHTHNIVEIDNPEPFVVQYRHSVTLAKEAGFDGIELLSQGGLAVSWNQDSAPDDYNDTAVSYQGLSKTYTYYIEELMRRDLAFINLSRRGCDVGRETDEYFESPPRPQGKKLAPKYDPFLQCGPMVRFPGSQTMLMVNHEYTMEEASALIETGRFIGTVVIFK